MQTDPQALFFQGVCDVNLKIVQNFFSGIYIIRLCSQTVVNRQPVILLVRYSVRNATINWECSFCIDHLARILGKQALTQ